MSQKIKNVEAKVSLNDGSNSKQNKEGQQIDYMEKKEQLVKDFGTNKSKKIINNRRTNVVDEENISSTKAMHEILKKTAQEMEKNISQSRDEILKKKINSAKQILPEFDLEAEDPDKIYKISSSKLIFLFQVLQLEDANQISIKELCKTFKQADGVENLRNR